MGRTALYRDPVPFRPARAEVQLEPDALTMRMPDGQWLRFSLDGCTPVASDGFMVARTDVRTERRFVRMLALEQLHARIVLVTPPDQGAVAPNVVRVPEAPPEAAILDTADFDALCDWVLGGGRLACAIVDLARLAAIASPQFAAVIGEVCAQRALELVWAARGPLRGGSDLESALQPLSQAARHSQRAAEALMAALAHASGITRRRRRG